MLPKRATGTESAAEVRALGLGLQARILLVDDDDAVRQATADMLGELEYDVVDVGSVGAAFDVLESQQIDLLLRDFAMPGMSGADVADLVLRRYPKLAIVFVTGYADRARLEGISEVQAIGKPFEVLELADTVARALSQHLLLLVRGRDRLLLLALLRANSSRLADPQRGRE